MKPFRKTQPVPTQRGGQILRLATAILVVAAALLLGGCGGSGDTERTGETAHPFAGQAVEIMIPREAGLTEAMQLVLNEWAAQTGADYRISEYALSDADNLLQTAESNASASVLLLPIAQLPEFAAADLLMPIPRDQQRESALDWLDLFQGLRQSVASVGSEPLVVPVSCPVLVCYYRRDLLDAAGLSPPTTWGDYQKLLDSLDSWAPGLTAVEPWGPEYRATMFLARAVAFAKHPSNYSLFFDIDTASPLIDHPGFVRGLEAARAAVSKMPAEVLGYAPHDCRQALLSGQAALAVTFETGPDSLPYPFGPPKAAVNQDAADGGDSPMAETVSGPQRSDEMELGFVRLLGTERVYNHSTKAWGPAPGGRGINQPTLTAFGGLCAGVTAGGSELQAQAAWNLLATLIHDPTFSGMAGTPCRDAHLASPGLWVGSDLAAQEAYDYLNIVAQSLRSQQVVAEFPVLGRGQFRSTLAAGLQRAFTEDVSSEEVLAEVARQWQRIVEEHGSEKIRNSYRRGLGLSVR